MGKNKKQRAKAARERKAMNENEKKPHVTEIDSDNQKSPTRKNMDSSSLIKHQQDVNGGDESNVTNNEVGMSKQIDANGESKNGHIPLSKADLDKGITEDDTGGIGFDGVQNKQGKSQGDFTDEETGDNTFRSSVTDDSLDNNQNEEETTENENNLMSDKCTDQHSEEDDHDGSIGAKKDTETLPISNTETLNTRKDDVHKSDDEQHFIETNQGQNDQLSQLNDITVQAESSTTLQECKSRLENELKCEKQELEELKERANELEREKVQIQQSVDETEKAFHQKLETLQQQLESVTKENGNLSECKSRLENELKCEKQELEDLKERANELEREKEDRDQLENKFEEVLKELKGLKEKAAKLENQEDVITESWKESTEKTQQKLTSFELELTSARQEKEQVVDWFYKLELRCDNIDVNCIVDKRLEKQYSSLQSVYGRQGYKEFEASTFSIKPKFGNPTKMSEFEAIYTMRQKQQPHDYALNSLLLDASKKKQPFLCRWILFTLQNREDNSTIERALDIALNKTDIHTARVLAWCITNIFYKIYQDMLADAVNIYPGVFCRCNEKQGKERVFCSKDLTIVVILQQSKMTLLPQTFKGFEIKVVELNNLQRSEGISIIEYTTRKACHSVHLKMGISNETAQNLFLNHKNLGLICPSIGKSRHFTSKRHAITDELCIQLHCTKKGIIPIGNEHFPSTINGCPTDVIESQPYLLSNLRIGDTIGPQTSTGTLGGFVRYLDVFDCFLTCAHVMYDLKTLLDSSSNFAKLPGAKAYLHTPHGTVECGNVIRPLFDHDDKSRTSVDAALVVLNNATVNPNDILSGSSSPRTCFDLGLSSILLNDICLDHEEFCITTQTADTVSAGAMTKLVQSIKFPRQSDVDVQFSNTGPTAASVKANVYHPLWMFTPAHLQLPSGYLTDRRIFRMYNQMAVNLPLVQGDSGTCIYIVNHPGNKNGCIGMAIAFCGGLTLVTPLKEIFKRMNMS